MSDTVNSSVLPPRRLHFEWVMPVLRRPTQTFQEIVAQGKNAWLTPILILSVTALLYTLVNGYFKQQTPSPAPAMIPSKTQEISPDTQIQLQQAKSLTQGPTFVYALPAAGALIQVWFGWLLVGGLLHLALTMLGGRGDTRSAMTVVAWGGLPLAVRDTLRICFILVAHTPIATPSLAGFAPSGEGALPLFLTTFLGFVDLFMLWHLALLVIGVQVSTGLPRLKSLLGVTLTLLLVLSLQGLVGYGLAKLNMLSPSQPFF